MTAHEHPVVPADEILQPGPGHAAGNDPLLYVQALIDPL